MQTHQVRQRYTAAIATPAGHQRADGHALGPGGRPDNLPAASILTCPVVIVVLPVRAVHDGSGGSQIADFGPQLVHLG